MDQNRKGFVNITCQHSIRHRADSLQGGWLFYTIFSLLFLMGCTLHHEEPFIAINQVGYESNAPKHAYLVNARADRFELVRIDDSKVVFTDSIPVATERDEASGDQLSLIDFSEYVETGEYRIRVLTPDHLVSNPIVIAQSIYTDALRTIAKSYYFHRCGTVTGSDSGWGYELCHVDDAPFFDDPESTKKVRGGWHDAGDYNKFSGNTALSVGLMLYAYESNSGIYFDDELNIPESGNGVPDVLDEAQWALEWLLTMQREDGAVYHKVSQKKWLGEYLPHKDPAVRYLFEVSSAATASLAAVTAMASRHFQMYDPAFARRLKGAAERAWNWLEVNNGNVPEGGFKNPEGVIGGEYGDPVDLDERLWAATELYRLTNNRTYQKFFVKHYIVLLQEGIPPISWRDANSLALYAFLHSDLAENKPEIKKGIHKEVIRHADSLLGVREQNAYKNVLTPEQYYWGSNSVILAYAFDLLQAFDVTGNLKYQHAAYDQLHFVLGRNPLNLSQVTGVGTNAVSRPYHQLSEMDNNDAPIAGMLVGGPNDRLHLNNEVISPYPAKNYEDAFENYLVNEPAINFTAILLNVTSALTPPTDKVGSVTIYRP